MSVGSLSSGHQDRIIHTTDSLGKHLGRIKGKGAGRGDPPGYDAGLTSEKSGRRRLEQEKLQTAAELRLSRARAAGNGGCRSVLVPAVGPSSGTP